MPKKTSYSRGKRPPGSSADSSSPAPAPASGPRAGGGPYGGKKSGGRDRRGQTPRPPKRGARPDRMTSAPVEPNPRASFKREQSKPPVVAPATHPASAASPTSPAKKLGDIVAGRHAVEATLRHNALRGKQLFVQEALNESAIIVELARKVGIAVHKRDRAWLDVQCGTLVHQGFVLQVTPYVYEELDEVNGDVVLILDGLEDPRNLGAAARAALAMGACALVIPDRRAARVTAAAEKTAAGAFARLPVVIAPNLRRALEALKERGYWIVGAEADAKQAPHEVDLSEKIALVVGGENRGLRRLTREACDHVVAIPMQHPDLSLNAADAAALLLYEAQRQRLSAR